MRYAECDLQGIVFNPHYLAYVDVSLNELWRATFGGYTAVTERGVDVVVAEANIVYRAAARFDDELDIAVTVPRFGTTSMATRHRITRVSDGALVADARLRYVWIEVNGHAKTAIPDWARAALQAHHVADEGEDGR